MNRKLIFTSSALCAGAVATIAIARAATTPPRVVPFDALALTLEINATDVDSGVLFSSDTDESVEFLMIQDPHGNTIYQAQSSDPLQLGLTEIFWETAEPDLHTALAAYPEGDYTVMAHAFDGTVVTGVVHLSHDFPGRPKLLSPQDGDELNIHHVVVEWIVDPDVDHYWLEVEGEDQDEYVIQLPSTGKFTFPDELLQPSSSYKFGLGAVGRNGNVIVVEAEFDTRP